MPADIEAALAAKDGKRAIALLKELKDLGRDGWPLAMKLMTDLQKGLDEGNPLAINSNDFYKIAASPAFAPLHIEALQNPKDYPQDFRIFAAYSLPWSGVEGLEDLYLKQLATEPNPAVVRAMAEGIAGQPSPGAVSGMLTALEVQQDEGSRKAIVQSLVGMPGDEATRALEGIAASETDPSVRSIAANAYAGRTAGVGGYLVTSTVPGSQSEAAGVQAGDIVTAYRGQPITSMSSLERAKTAAAADEVVDVTVRRNGKDVVVRVRAGTLGINGMIVQPPGK